MIRGLINYIIGCTMLFSLVEVNISIIEMKMREVFEKQGLDENLFNEVNKNMFMGHMELLVYSFIPVLNIIMLIKTFSMASKDIEKIELLDKEDL